MNKMLENQQSVKKDYYNEPANKWLREYLEQINTKGYGNKVDNDKEFANRSNIKYSKIRTITGGSSPVTADELIKISKATGISTDDILFGKELPDRLKFNGIDELSKESYNILHKHTMPKGTLFPARDGFLIFLDYLIQEESFIDVLSSKSSELKEKFKDNKEIYKLADYKNFEDFKNRFSDKQLSKELRDIITDSGIRNSVRDFIYKYLYDNLK